MCVSPFLQFLFLLFCLVFPVGNDVQKLQCSHPPHIIPGASAGLGHRIHIGYPSPLVLIRLSRDLILSSICILLVSFLIALISCLQ